MMCNMSIEAQHEVRIIIPGLKFLITKNRTCNSSACSFPPSRPRLRLTHGSGETEPVQLG
jgi:hypothetical protein